MKTWQITFQVIKTCKKGSKSSLKTPLKLRSSINLALISSNVQLIHDLSQQIYLRAITTSKSIETRLNTPSVKILDRNRSLIFLQAWEPNLVHRLGCIRGSFKAKRLIDQRKSKQFGIMSHQQGDFTPVFQRSSTKSAWRVAFVTLPDSTNDIT